MEKPIRIAPSILSANFARLGEDVAAAEAAGAALIHVDVMDGHFVPNITMGPVIVKSLRPVTTLPLDVHLMISEPARYIDAFAEAGADALTIHIEADPHIHRTLQHIKDLGLQAGVTLNPGTPVSAISAVAGMVDLVLVMTVNPGFGGQKFIEGSLSRIAQMRALLDEVAPHASLSVDGGVDASTAGKVAAAGADILVAGSAVFKAKDGVAGAVARIKQAAGAR